MILFWAALLALAILLYVLLDGFDLGVGILFAFADEPGRRKMLAAISPVWDGNETWLVVTGTVLFGAFPVVSAAGADALRPDPARRRVRVSVQGVGRLSLDLGCELCWRIVGRDLHSGN